MRRYGRSGAGGTIYAQKANGPGIPDPISLIRSFDSETLLTRPTRPSPLATSNIQGLPLDLLERLRSFPLFQSAPDSFLAAIGSYLRPQLHSPHDYILTEGDEAKAMYWLVRGALRVTSRDGESTYVELKPGAFFGEIGILMDIPRTATIIAKLKSLVVRLNKEDLQKVLPNYPDVERVIRDEATERLTILERKKRENGHSKSISLRPGKRPRDSADGDVLMGEAGILRDGQVISSKKRKSPSPSLADAVIHSGLGSATFNVRHLLKELPLFASLPPEILHFIGMNAQPKTYPPFTDIIKQGSTGRDVFFIVRGEVEVINEMPLKLNGFVNHGEKTRMDSIVKARLKAGQYFGEVVSLSLAKRRTATVRSVSAVECLIISGNVLDELWNRCSPDLRRQVELTAKNRLEAAKPNHERDVAMADADATPAIGRLEIEDVQPREVVEKPPKVTFPPSEPLGRIDEIPKVESVDPDPYLNVDLESVRSRSRRSSLAPPSPGHQSQSDLLNGDPPRSPHKPNGIHRLSWPASWKSEPASPIRRLFARRSATFVKPRPQDTIGIFPDKVLINIFKYFDIHELMKLRIISNHWKNLVCNNQDIMKTLDLSEYNRFVTDDVLTTLICPFIGTRPRHIDISNCFHVTDEGFNALATQCAASVKSWRMKSVWDITAQAILDMVNLAKGLEDVDLSNCRKVGDNLLARVVGWVVPEISPNMAQHNQQVANRRMGQRAQAYHAQNQGQAIAPGTVVGCPQLKRLTLSYCKHITDRSMAHISSHASSRIEEIDFTRCTTITDAGFQHWGMAPFPRLRKLILADCTYLTDHAIVCLTNAAKALRELDLSFCCALSDTATEVIALGCPSLTHLNLAFCGSAVSDGSLRSIGLHLLELQSLCVRGCVRVTGMGVEAVVDGCAKLEHFDVSQCRNLQGWIDEGGIERVNAGNFGAGLGKRKIIKFDVVADGSWRGGRG